MEQEKIGKIFILFVVLLFFGCTYYYYGYVKVNTAGSSHKEIAQANLQSKVPGLPEKNRHPELVSGSIQQTIKTLSPDGKMLKAAKLPDKYTLHESITKLHALALQHENLPEEGQALKQQVKQEKISAQKIKPSSKSTLMNLLGSSSGKQDPFSYSESNFMPFNESSNANTPLPGGLPPIPGAGNIGSLPSLPGAPSLSGMNSLPAPPPKPGDSITIKGFIGNKVITEVDGVIMALNLNEKFNNIKVLSINPQELKAGFEIDGKFITKTLKSLTDNSGESVQIVKNSHN